MKSVLNEYILNVLLEKKYFGMKLEILTRKLVKRFIQELKSPEIYKMMKAQNDVEIIVTPDEINLFDDKVDIFQLNVIFDDSIDEEGLTIESRGSYDKDKNLTRLSMDLFFPRSFNVRDIESIYPELLENFRHELEHAYQKTNVSSPDTLKTIKDFRMYFLSNDEIEAFVVGLKIKAKSKKMSLKHLVSDKISNILDYGRSVGIKETELQNFKNDLETAYFDYAKKRYPESM